MTKAHSALLARTLSAALCVTAALPLACAAPSGTPAAAAVDVRALRTAGAPVLDVRSPAEWAEGHLEGSTLVPLPELEQRLAEIEALVGGDKSKPLIVVCRSGNRAGQAQALLRARGFTQVHNGGGWTALR